MVKTIPDNVLTYPLPPWEHDFRVLAIFGEVDTEKLAPLVPKPLSLCSNVVQISVMHFASTVPKEPYYDAAVIADVEYGGVRGGYWVYGFTSTDTVQAGTREIWGYRMKRGDDWTLDGDGKHFSGYVSRRGKKVIAIDMRAGEVEFTPPALFPRLFLKVFPKASRAEADIKKVVVMRAVTTAMYTEVKGDAKLILQRSELDPLYRLEPIQSLGAVYLEGHQILPWAEELD